MTKQEGSVVRARTSLRVVAFALGTVLCITVIGLLVLNKKIRELLDRRAADAAIVSRATLVTIRLQNGAFGALLGDPEAARTLGAAALRAGQAAKLEVDAQTKQGLALVMSSGDATKINVDRAFWARADQGRVQAFDLPSTITSRLTLSDSHGRYAARSERAVVLSAQLFSASSILWLPVPASGQRSPDGGGGSPGSAPQVLVWRGPGQIDAVAIAPSSDEAVLVTTEGQIVTVDFGASPPALTVQPLGAGAPARPGAAPRFSTYDATALDPTGRWVATASGHAITVRDVQGGAHAWQASLALATASVRGLWLAPTGRLAAWDSTETLHVWDPPEPLASAQPPPQGRAQGGTSLVGDVRDLEFGVDGRVMVIVMASEIRLFKADPLLQRYTFDASASRAQSWHDAALSLDGKRLGARGSNGVVALWDTEGGRTLFQRKVGQFQTTATFSADAKSLLLVDRTSVRSLDFDAACGEPSLDQLAAPIPAPRATDLEAALEDLVPALSQGVRDAREGKLQEAEMHLHDAETWPGVRFAPDLRAEVTTIRIDALVATAVKASGDGNVAGLQSAIDQLEGLGEAGKKKAAEAAASLPITHSRQGQHEIGDGRFADALKDYRTAMEGDPKTLTADDWNNLCWEGAIHGAASDVLFACDEAVATAGTMDWQFRDSRGVARGIAGDTAGAIDDLAFRVAHSAEYRDERSRWLAALRAGQSPFTPEVVKHLASE